MSSIRAAILSILVALPGAAFAAPAAARSGGMVPPPATLTVTGSAAIFDDNVPAARDRAVEAALLRAVEQYAGLRIEATTLIKKGELIDREVKAHARGFVKSHEVLEESRAGNELVVKVRVEVSPKPVEEAFRKYLSATTTLLLVTESNLGKPVPGQVLAAALADPFFTSKVIVPPASTLDSARGKVPAAFFSNPDPGASKELGIRYLAGLIVVAQVSTKKLDSGADSLGYKVEADVLRPVVAAEGNVTILSGQDGRVIASRRFDDVRGSDSSDATRAGMKALQTLSESMRAFMVEKLSEQVKALGYELRVVVTGDAAANGAERVRQALESTRWVRRVEVGKEEPGQTVLKATTVENPFYVVEELRHSGRLKVVRFDSDRAEVAVK